MNRPILLAITAVLAACGAGPVPDTTAAPRAAPDTTASEPVAILHLAPYAAGLLSVTVAVGDTTYPFIFDTGGGVTLVTPEVAEALGCLPFGRTVGFRHDGEAIEASRCPPVALDIAGWRSPAGEVAVWDLMALIPEGLPTLGGLVSLGTFDGLAVTLDLGNERVLVETPGSFASRVENADPVPVRMAHQAGGVSLDVFLAVEAQPGRLWFELDSGNAGPVFIAPHAAEMLGLELSDTRPTRVTLVLPGHGPITVDAQEKAMIYDGLLNAAFLRDLTMTLDLEYRRAWISR
jgi:predicted aspartyl protease